MTSTVTQVIFATVFEDALGKYYVHHLISGKPCRSLGLHINLASLPIDNLLAVQAIRVMRRDEIVYEFKTKVTGHTRNSTIRVEVETQSIPKEIIGEVDEYRVPPIPASSLEVGDQLLFVL